jgi:bifunctional non-homologous end joining protein LigD
MVEDHPLDYGSFEGVIPKGAYGAGQVIVWDTGTYAPDEDGRVSDDRAEAEERMRRGLSEGKLSILMRGRKLRGSWALVRMKGGEGKDWLLIKHKDRFVDSARDVLDEDRSVLSGLSIDDLKAGRLPDRARAAAGPEDLPGARRARFPTSVEPMFATLTDTPFSNPAWLFEPKLDGARAIALIREGRVKLLSRSGRDATRQYPALAEELAGQPEPRLALDGEIVAMDDDGRPSFQRLQQRLNLSRDADIKRAETQVPVFYYAFDLLYAGDYDLRAVPLAERKALLGRLLLPSERVRLLEHFEEDGEAAYEAAVAHGIEGVVAKRRDSVYEPGRRSRHWLKVKATLSDEFVVGGFSEGQGGRADTFGSLLLGQYDEEGRLVYAGNVGSGFDDRTLAALRRRLDGLTAEDCPFSEAPVQKAPRRTATGAAVTWVRPELVVEVKFAQWTDDGHLRAPVFLRLREDKPPAAVRRSEVVPAPCLPAGRPSATAADDAATLRSEVESVLDQLGDKRDRFVLKVGGKKVSLTNLDKEFWPAYGGRRALTKRDLLVYLAKVSPLLLPHLRDRPLSLTRYPDGIHGEHFYQKRWEFKLPDFVDTVRFYSEHNKADDEYLICDNLPTLLWLGQLADLELHTWYSRVSPEPDGHHLSTTFTGSARNINRSLLNYPDFIVFDLDPYIYSGKESPGDEPELNRKAFAGTCRVALWLKDILDSLSLSSFVKTSGRTGLHVYVPIRRELNYDAVRSACETIGRFLLAQHPRDVTMDWTVEKRKGKVFFDHNQNVRGKTLASVYSPRPLPEAAVSMPLRWDELTDVYPADFTLLTAPDLLAARGDLWAGILDAKHDLQRLLDLGAGSEGQG